MSTDTRVRITKMLIKNSFLNLLRTTPLDKISVTKICTDAQINRITFYKHYLDIFDLYEQIVEEHLNETFAVFAEKADKYDLKKALQISYQDIYDNPDKYALLFSENVSDKYKMKSMELCHRKLSELQIYLLNIPEEERKILQNFLSYGCGGVLMAWAKDGMKTNPIDLANKQYQLIESVMKSYI